MLLQAFSPCHKATDLGLSRIVIQFAQFVLYTVSVFVQKARTITLDIARRYCADAMTGLSDIETQ